MNEGKKKRIFVLLWILIIMMTYYSTTNVNFSEQNVTKSKMEILEKPQSPNEYSCAATPQIRQTGNRLSGLAETAYASLLAQCFV